jgi:mannitol/fructose-specific phosphotransferase system IIA component (Ntr-type)
MDLLVHMGVILNKDEALRLALEALSEAHYVVEHRQDVKKREQPSPPLKPH